MQKISLSDTQFYNEKGESAVALPIIETEELNMDNLPKNKAAIYHASSQGFIMPQTGALSSYQVNFVKVIPGTDDGVVMQEIVAGSNTIGIAKVYHRYYAADWTQWAPVTEIMTPTYTSGAIGYMLVPSAPGFFDTKLLKYATQTEPGVVKVYVKNGYLCIDTE